MAYEDPATLAFCLIVGALGVLAALHARASIRDIDRELQRDYEERKRRRTEENERKNTQ